MKGKSKKMPFVGKFNLANAMAKKGHKLFQVKKPIWK
jgi:hypothetical protein